MKIKFNNENEFHAMSSYGIGQHQITIFRFPENLNGFVLYENDEETQIQDCSEFIYRYNPYDNEKEYGVIYTDIPDYVKPAPDPNGKVIIYEPPISQDELTEAVADLMVEVDTMKLGL